MKALFKQAIIIAIIMCVILSFCSCHFYGDNKKEDELFDVSLSHLPTEDDMKKIKQGMSFNEVVSIIGKPHSYAPHVSHNFALLWNTKEGSQYTILFLLEEKTETKFETAIDYFNHSIACKPTLVNNNISE